MEGWRRRPRRRIGVVDAGVVIWAGIGAHLIRFGLDESDVVAGASPTPYILLTLLLPLIWWLMLAAWGSREPRVLGSGSDEYKRVFAASLWLFGGLVIVSYPTQMGLARGYVGMAFPVGVVGLMVGRWVVRQHLNLDRARGKSITKVLLVGGPHAVNRLARALRSLPQAGYAPVGAYLAGVGSQHVDQASDVPVLGSEPTAEGIMSAAVSSGADAVALTAGAHLPPTVMHHLGWDLSAAGIGMIVAPAVTDIAGSRIHTQPVAGCQ